MDQDDYFKDFKLADYRFIVANRKTLTPLVWLFDNTNKYGDLMTVNNFVMRDPFTIGEELTNYLNSKPSVPKGINLVEPNKLEDWL